MKAYTLVGVNGNAFCIMGYVKDAMDDAKMSKEEIGAYIKDATSSDYDHLLAVSCDMIDKVNDLLGLNINDDEDEDYGYEEDY